MMYNSPCKGCTNRIVGCHSTCRDYNEYKVNHEWELELIRREKQKELIANDYIAYRNEYYSKRRGRKSFEK